MTVAEEAQVIVVGDQRLADILAICGAKWLVYPALPSVGAMWDAMDAQTIPAVVSAIIITDGMADNVDELEMTLAAFAPFATTFIVADPVRGQAIVSRARQLAPTVEGGDPNAPLYVLPANDLAASLKLLQEILKGKVEWALPEPAKVEAPAPVIKVAPPSVPPVQPYTAPSPIATPPKQVVYETPVSNDIVSQTIVPPVAAVPRDYEQASVYSPQVTMQASMHLSKLPNAIPGQVTIACMSSKGGSGKCGDISKTHLYHPITGEPKTLGDVLADDTMNEIFSFDGRFISNQRINDKIYSGEKETFKVLLNSGKSLYVTANHPVLTTSGWKALEDVHPGETIATPSKVPFPLQPQEMDSAELDILALIMAEGGTSQSSSTGFTSNDSEIVQILEDALEVIGLKLSRREHPMQFFITGIVPIPVKEDSCYCGCGRECDSNGISVLTEENENKHWTTDNHWMRQFRLEHGLEGTLAKNKTMPNAVYRLNEEQLARFISLFWMCDGYASYSGGGDVGITLASKKLIYAFQHLLLRFGIQSSVKYKASKSDNKVFDAWRLTVQASSYRLLRDKIGLWGYKGENLQKLIDRADTKGSNPNLGCPTFDDSVYDALLKYKTPTLAQQVLKELGWKAETYASPSMVLSHKATKGTGFKHLNLKGLKAWCELAGSDAEREFGWIYDSEIAWDEIVSIESEGINPVGDLEVPGTHNFVANDIIVHNSTTALCLAGTIAKSTAAAGVPKRVVVVDLDTRDGQLGSLIGQYMPTAVSIRVMPKWDAETVQANLVRDKKMNIDALLAPVRPRNADDVGPDFYRQIIQVLQTTHDVVILDCSVNYLDPLLGVGFALADEILFVTTLATTSVEGMARALTELFAAPNMGGLGLDRNKVGIVANQVITNVNMNREKLLRAALGAPLIGQIPAEYDTVLLATNQNRMSDLLKHYRLGPAYLNLARMCLPNWKLESIVAEANTVQSNPATQEEEAPAKRRFLGRG